MTDCSFYFKEKYRIPSVRLKNWDYSSSGWYYVTICIYQKRCYFGEIRNKKMILSKIGELAEKFWLEIPKHFKNVLLDEHIVMPNHIHGIIVIKYQIKSCRDVINHVSTKNNHVSTKNKFKNISPMGKNNLGEIIRWYKGRVTYEIRKINLKFLWQSRFYEHIIRDEKSLNEIREYTKNNPLKWEEDEENPKNSHDFSTP